MKITGRKVLITGAAGFIGSHLADRLAADNQLVLVDDFSVGRRENLEQLSGKSNVTIVTADICDRERTVQLCAGVDVVFHLAISCLRTSLNHPWLSHDINAGGTLSVCLAARAQKVQRLLYVSSSEIYGSAAYVPMDEDHPCRPTTVYGASKLAGETYALACWRTYGLPVTVVRPFNTYGPREPYHGARAEVIPRFILQLLSGRAPVIFGDGAQTRDFTFVQDTVRGIVSAAECDDLVGDVVNVAYGAEVSIAQIAAALAQRLGSPELTAVHSDPRPGDVERHFADIRKARQLLGFAPSVDIHAGLAMTIEWFQTNQILARVDAQAAENPNW